MSEQVGEEVTTHSGTISVFREEDGTVTLRLNEAIVAALSQRQAHELGCILAASWYADWGHVLGRPSP